MVLEHVFVHVCAMARWAKFSFGSMQQILFYKDLSNLQYSFTCIGGSHHNFGCSAQIGCHLTCVFVGAIAVTHISIHMRLFT